MKVTRMRHSSRRVRGFTLVELVVTILILAILSAMAMPSFRNFMRRNTVTSQSNALLADIQYARNKAISERTVTGLCPSSAGTSCSASNALENGWAVYRENTPGAAATLSADDDLLHMSQSKNGVSIRLVDGGGAAVQSIGFNQQGELLSGTGVSFLICARSSGDSIGKSTPESKGSELFVSSSGRPTIRQMAAGASCST